MSKSLPAQWNHVLRREPHATAVGIMLFELVPQPSNNIIILVMPVRTVNSDDY
jgi:hypothetical protein